MKFLSSIGNQFTWEFEIKRFLTVLYIITQPIAFLNVTLIA